MTLKDELVELVDYWVDSEAIALTAVGVMLKSDQMRAIHSLLHKEFTNWCCQACFDAWVEVSDIPISVIEWGLRDTP